MITISCLGSYGRLGNQMFQYATGYALAKKHNSALYIPSTDIYGGINGNQLVQTFEISYATIGNVPSLNFSYNESSFSYNCEVLNLPNNIDIRGYFQCEKYFDKYRMDLIENEFKFKDSVVKRSTQLIEKIKNDSQINELCSVHIRLGDYINLANVHNNLDIDYYESAMKILPLDVTGLVFSDNINLAEKMIKKSNIKQKMVYIDENYDLSLKLMSVSNYHVIANSSYSWWGAWLSDSKKVIAPSIWFGNDGPKHWNDIYCKKWIIL